jgi:hypothetical protein
MSAALGGVATTGNGLLRALPATRAQPGSDVGPGERRISQWLLWKCLRFLYSETRGTHSSRVTEAGEKLQWVDDAEAKLPEKSELPDIGASTWLPTPKT